MERMWRILRVNMWSVVCTVLVVRKTRHHRVSQLHATSSIIICSDDESHAQGTVVFICGRNRKFVLIFVLLFVCKRLCKMLPLDFVQVGGEHILLLLEERWLRRRAKNECIRSTRCHVGTHWRWRERNVWHKQEHRQQ